MKRSPSPLRQRVTTDGSARTGTKGERGPGGWAAVVVDGSRRKRELVGCEALTNNGEMELRGVAEGLAEFPDGTQVELVFDCTIVISVFDRWQRSLPQSTCAYPELRARIAAEFDRLDVRLRLLERSEKDSSHRRAHQLAKRAGVELYLERLKAAKGDRSVVVFAPAC